jgi:hypothetical protein
MKSNIVKINAYAFFCLQVYLIPQYYYSIHVCMWNLEYLLVV